MLIYGSSLKDRAILSLHIAGEIARVVEPIIDPTNLKVIALRVEGPLVRGDVGDIIPIESVREISHMGLIVDSIDELVDGDEVVRIRDILKLHFNLVGLKVVTKKQSKLGKVSDFTVDATSWETQQLVIRRPAVKSLLDPELMISCSEIVEIDDYKIIVKDEHDKPKSKASASKTVLPDFTPNFVNPFRKPDFASDVKDLADQRYSSSSGR